jgi:kynureninase
MPADFARHAELLTYRREFPLLTASVYLNTCSLGARGERSRGRLDEFLADWDSLGARAWYRRWLGELDGLRGDFGSILGVPSTEISLAPNVSTSLAVIASALDPIHRGDLAALGRLREAGVPVGDHPRTRVITTALDFPTVGHQWLARAPLGVELVVLPSPDGLTVPLEAFAAAVDERAALVATSHVYFTTGTRVDLARLAQVCHEHGALFLVDGYQATGIVPTELASSGVDAYVSGTLKWLFGGPGTAFAWIRPALYGARAQVADTTVPLLERIRAVVAGRLPVAVGFGVSEPAHIGVLAPAVDGVIVGSALVSALEAGGPQRVGELVHSLAAAASMQTADVP